MLFSAGTGMDLKYGFWFSVLSFWFCLSVWPLKAARPLLCSILLMPDDKTYQFIMLYSRFCSGILDIFYRNITVLTGSADGKDPIKEDFPGDPAVV